MVDYRLMEEQIKSLIENKCLSVGNLSNICAFLYHNLEHLNWVGMYKLEGEVLNLYTFNGKPACTLIPIDKGICGKAVRERNVIVIDDVHQVKDHIACDSASNSEMVVPLYINNNIWGVLDIDSDIKRRFEDEEIQTFLKRVGKIIERILVDAK